MHGQQNIKIIHSHIKGVFHFRYFESGTFTSFLLRCLCNYIFFLFAITNVHITFVGTLNCMSCLQSMSYSEEKI